MKSMDSITVEACAKINLTLDILGKTDNGYHELRSIMQSVSLCDELSIRRAESGSGITLECSDKSVPSDGRNLAVRAANAFFAYHGMTGDVSFGLTKRIPSMAGMAGGSADCAAALIGLDRLYGTETPKDGLMRIAASLGADVPFCMEGGARICEGIGERLTCLPPMPDCFIAVAKPDVCISTPEAYAEYDRKASDVGKSDFEGICQAFYRRDMHGICKRLFNALEAASDCGEVFRVKKAFEESGAIASLMTGSGSAVFGVFAEREQALQGMKAADCAFTALCRPVGFGNRVTECE